MRLGSRRCLGIRWGCKRCDVPAAQPDTFWIPVYGTSTFEAACPGFIEFYGSRVFKVRCKQWMADSSYSSRLVYLTQADVRKLPGGKPTGLGSKMLVFKPPNPKPKTAKPRKTQNPGTLNPQPTTPTPPHRRLRRSPTQAREMCENGQRPGRCNHDASVHLG